MWRLTATVHTPTAACPTNLTTHNLISSLRTATRDTTLPSRLASVSGRVRAPPSIFIPQYIDYAAALLPYLHLNNIGHTTCALASAGTFPTPHCSTRFLWCADGAAPHGRGGQHGWARWRTRRARLKGDAGDRAGGKEGSVKEDSGRHTSCRISPSSGEGEQVSA